MCGGGRSGCHRVLLRSGVNGDIPARFTCSGEDLSPALAWTDPPAGTRSFALITDDPDAPSGTFTHWVVYDLPPSARQLPEGVPRTADPEGGRQGRNDFDKIGYSGPCPPPGNPHRYSFRLYALDRKMGLRAGASKSDLERALKGHVLAQSEWIGRFGR
jgi:Raf kinase inhibitor-like YbhB/YbcL family protein